MAHRLKIFRKSFFLTSILIVILGFLVPFVSLLSVEATPKVDDVSGLTLDLNNKRDEVDKAQGSIRDKKKDELKKIASDRRRKLEQLIKTNPEEVLKNAVNESDFPEEVRGDLEKRGEQKGFIGRIHSDDFKTGKSEDHFYLNKSKKFSKDSIELVSDIPNLDLPIGKDEASVNGVLVGNVMAFAGDSNLSLFGAATAGIPTTGQLKVAVYYATFLDQSGRNNSMDNYFNVKLNNFLASSSSSNVSIVASVYPVNMIMNKSCDLSKLIAEATRAVGDQFFVNPDDYDVNAIVFDAPYCTSGPPGAMGEAVGGKPWFYSIGVEPIAHEFGHALGLAHAEGYYCGDTSVRDNCEWIPYGDPTDIMGSEAGQLDVFSDPDYGAYAKDYLGWYKPGDVVDVSASGSYKINQFEDNNSGQKVLKIHTFSGGPVYYVLYKKRALDGLGPLITLASGSIGRSRRTLLLDMSPGSKNDPRNLDDFKDAYLADGQTFQDPFNGIKITSIARGLYDVTLQVDVGQQLDGNGTIRINWTRPVGYEEVAGQKKDVTWQAVNYILSHRCTSGFGCDPNVWTDENATTNHNGSFLVANSDLGYNYEYKVYVLTKADGNPNALGRYITVGPTAVSNTCSGQTSCTIPIFWSSVPYRVTLLKVSDGSAACAGISLGCVDAIAISDSTTLKFRGLTQGVALRGEVRVPDSDGTLHFLQDLGNLGSSEGYSFSCSSQSLSCSVQLLSFNGAERVNYTVKLNNASGITIRGPEDTYAGFDGSFSRSWLWNYQLVAFPAVFADCYAAGASCRTGSILNTGQNTFIYTFQGLRPRELYKYYICATTCSTNGIIKQDTTASDGFNITNFFANDPFAPTFSNQFFGEYFDNSDFTNLMFSRVDSQIRFNWGIGSPGAPIAADTYSARWTGNFNLNPVVYRLAITSESGGKVYFDGNKVIDSTLPAAVAINATSGYHLIKVEYSHNIGNSTVNFGLNNAYTCADVNGDGKINSTDLLTVAKHQGQLGITPWDVNGDLKVNSTDLLVVAKRAGTTCP